MFSQRIERLSGSLIREILSLAQQDDVISFAGGLPAAETLPALSLDGMPPQLAQYGPSEGEPALRRQVAAYARSIGLDCTPEQVLILAGSQQALDLCAKLFIDPATPIVTEAPTYLAALQVFRLFGAAIHGVAQTDGRLAPADLDAAIRSSGARVGYLIPSFQNPSGACYDAATRQALAAVFDAHETVLIEDDPYRELWYDAPTPAPMAASLKQAPWIYCGSFSKVLSPGLRLGYLIASPQLMTPLLRLKQAADLHCNRPGQWLVSRWLADPARDDLLAGLRTEYRVRRDAMQQALQRHFAALATWQAPQGGLFFWLRLNRPLDSRERLRAAIERRVVFMPGETFYPDPARGFGYLRLNFSHTPVGQMEEGVARLASVFG